MHERILLIGLGNPGAKYADTMHNVGFSVLDALFNAHRHCGARWLPRCGAEICEILYHHSKCYLLKPMTCMNSSGISVAQFLKKNVVTRRNIIAIHDDLDMQECKVRMRYGGGHGGHNGIKSLDQHIGQGYWRMKIGIGRPLNPHMEISDYVLSKMKNINDFEHLYSRIIQDLPLREDKSDFCSRINAH